MKFTEEERSLAKGLKADGWLVPKITEYMIHKFKRKYTAGDVYVLCRDKTAERKAKLPVVPKEFKFMEKETQAQLYELRKIHQQTIKELRAELIKARNELVEERAKASAWDDTSLYESVEVSR